jgi:para-aminobenzoate synthetase component II
VDRVPELVHGTASEIFPNGEGVPGDLSTPFTGTRDHLLSILPETMPDELEVTARAERGVIMALRHRWLPIDGV